MREQNLQLVCRHRLSGILTVPAGRQVTIGMKVETKPARAGTDGEGEGSVFVIQLPA